MASSTKIKRALLLLAAVPLFGSEADRAVLTAMRMSAPDVYYGRTLRREPVDADFDLVLMIGTSKSEGPMNGDSIYWRDRSPLGIFLQRRDRPATVYEISVSQNSEDCDEVSVENVTAKDVVLSCMPEKGGPGPNHKFVYDLRSKSLVKEFTFARFGIQRILAVDGGAVLVGRNAQRHIAIKYSSGENPAFHILNSAEVEQWARRLKADTTWVPDGMAIKPFIDIQPEAKALPRFGPDNRFSLVNGCNGLLVVARTGNATKRYPLPQTSHDELARIRPVNYARQVDSIEETIGPWQMVDGAFWFAKTFYDGEGNSGVGGFGFFDTDQRQYQIFAPHELVDSSATSILVEQDAVWLGLAANGEYGSVGIGLLRFDRATQTAQPIQVRGIISQIARVGAHLLLATDSGAIVLDNGTMHRYFVDQTTSGKLEITEPAPAQQR